MKILLATLSLVLAVNLYATYKLIKWTPVISSYSIMTYEGSRCTDEIRLKIYNGEHCNNYINDKDVYSQIRQEVPPNPLFKLFIPKAYWNLK